MSRDTNTTTQQEWFSVKAGALWLGGIGRKCLYKAIEAGELRASCVNGRKDYIIHRSWLVQWMEKQADCPRPSKAYHPRHPEDCDCHRHRRQPRRVADLRKAG